LQNGQQQPVAATLVAAVAVVVNTASSAVVHPSSLIFMFISLMQERSIRHASSRVRLQGDLKVKPTTVLDLQAGLRVLNEGMPGLLIGDVARRAGVSAPTIRYYEEIGVLVAPARSSTGYRRYAARAVEEVRFVKKAQALGFSLEEVAEILRLSRSGKAPCARVLSLARQHLAAVEERIRQLQHFREQLAAEVAKWDGQEQPTCDGLCEIITTARIGAQ
jgi:MerR family copper efflux transcriptional regulator